MRKELFCLPVLGQFSICVLSGSDPLPPLPFLIIYFINIASILSQHHLVLILRAEDCCGLFCLGWLLWREMESFFP